MIKREIPGVSNIICSRKEYFGSSESSFLAVHLTIELFHATSGVN